MQEAAVMRTRSTNITSMPQSIEDERRARMIKYAVMMGIRTVCFLALIWVRGPWMLVFAAGAIFLPYFAVIIANAVSSRRRDIADRPNAIESHTEERDWTPPASWFKHDNEAHETHGTHDAHPDQRQSKWRAS